MSGGSELNWKCFSETAVLYLPWNCKGIFCNVVGPAAPTAQDPASELKDCPGVWTGNLSVHVIFGPRPTVLTPPSCTQVS